MLCLKVSHMHSGCRPVDRLVKQLLQAVHGLGTNHTHSSTGLADSMRPWLQAGLADMRYWVQYMGSSWCGEVADAEQALEHSSQAVLYVLHGKNDCLRSAAQVTSPELCPHRLALRLQLSRSQPAELGGAAAS